MTRFTRTALLLVGLVSAIAAPVLAQDGGAAPTSPRGPMTFERVQSGFMLMPEVKATRMDGTSGALVGGAGGWVIDDSFVLGAAGYGLTNGRSGRRLGYGGVVLGWMSGTDGLVGFGGRGLIGFGSARIPETYLVETLVPGSRRPVLEPVTHAFSHDFAVFEPQADLFVRVGKHARLDWNVGYRLVGGERDVRDDRIRGVTAGVGMQFLFGRR